MSKRCGDGGLAYFYTFVADDFQQLRSGDAHYLGAVGDRDRAFGFVRQRGGLIGGDKRRGRNGCSDWWDDFAGGGADRSGALGCGGVASLYSVGGASPRLGADAAHGSHDVLFRVFPDFESGDDRAAPASGACVGGVRRGGVSRRTDLIGLCHCGAQFRVFPALDDPACGGDWQAAHVERGVDRHRGQQRHDPDSCSHTWCRAIRASACVGIAALGSGDWYRADGGGHGAFGFDQCQHSDHALRLLYRKARALSLVSRARLRH